MWKDYLRLHWIVFLWGFTAILGKLITLPAVEIVFYRTALAAVTLGALLTWRRRWRRLPAATAGRLLLTGAVIAAHWILFFAAARVSNVSVCLAGMATGSLWTSLLDPLLTRRRLEIFEVTLGGVVLAGLYVVFRFETDHALGLAMAVASALLSALFTIFNSQFARHHPPLLITQWEMMGAWASVALFLPFYGAYLTPGGSVDWVPRGWDLLWLAVLALVCTVYALAVSVALMRRFTAFAVNLAVNLEPVYGIALAALIFHEHARMTSQFYLGTALIMVAVLAYPAGHYLRRRWARPVNVPPR